MPSPTPQQGRSASKKGAPQQPPRLEERTREELFALARQLGIPGHADMTREELIEAIRRR